MHIVRKTLLGWAASRWLLSILLSAPALLSAASIATNTPPMLLGRYLVTNQDQESTALAGGARIVRQTRGLKAVVCQPALAKALGLSDDIRIRAADTAVTAQVGASPVQQDLGLTGRGRKIVVLDTGYNYNHPELTSSYLGGKDFIHNDDDPFDDNGHGSHVSGIITADGVDPRAKGIAPDTGIIAGKVLDSSGNGFVSDLVAGIYWAVDGPDGYYGTSDDFQADAINISIGGGTDAYPSVFCDGVTPSLTDAVRYARDHGVVVVAAAGNSGLSGVSVPGCVSYSVTVGAIDRSNVVAYFSGNGPSVDLVAPGVSVFSATLGTNYKSFSGTSQATPVVSGAIALFKQAFPNASVQDVENALFLTAVDLGWLGKDKLYGWGRMDVYQALGMLTANLATISLNATRSGDQLTISWPNNPPGFILESASQLDAAPSDWSTVIGSIIPVGNTNTTTTLCPAGTHRFYRLRWP